MMNKFCYVLLVFAFKIKPFDSQFASTPTPVCCLKDYVVNSCYNSCTEKTCANLAKGENRICTLLCQLGTCECKDDLYRNDCDVCVPKEQCSVPCKQSIPISCSGPFETLYGCWDPWQARVCPTVEQSRPRDIFLQYITMPNTNSLCVLNVCDCQEGYLRNHCGVCVKPEHCGAAMECGVQCNGVDEELKEIKFPLEKCKSERSCKKKCKKNVHCKCKRKKESRCHQHKQTFRVEHVCVCKDGFARNKCHRCVPESEAYDDVPCVCTNPCRSDPKKEWTCANQCNMRTCENMHTFPIKLCPRECIYGCHCSDRQNLWWNGTACIPSFMCHLRQEVSAEPISNI